ncbi:MAG: hypothetical protein ACYSYL_12115, partial [Planctomycetota bacterium]
MKNGILISSIIILIIVGSVYAEDKPTPPKYAIKAGKILTMAPADKSATDTIVINHGIILLSNGKIEALGPQAD